MKKYITLITTGLFLLSLQPAGAQRQVEPPAIPPMLEGQKPLANPETREPTAPKQAEESKAKPKAKAKAKAGKAQKKAGVKKAAPKKAVKKKAQQTNKKKPQETGVKHSKGAAVS
jgi:hypothetical protein